MTTPISLTTRRALLKKFSSLALAPVATPMALNLLGMANAAAQSADDYKALVCVFLFGGNDNYNTVIPYDTTSHREYYRVRKGTPIAGTPYEGIALPRGALAATALNSTTGLPSGLQIALGPTMSGLKSVFDAGRAGVLLNVGPLQVPTTKTQFDQRSVPLPPKLFAQRPASLLANRRSDGGRSFWLGRAYCRSASIREFKSIPVVHLG